MSIRKRNWKTAKGEDKEAWVVDYVDQHGKRRLKTFAKKKAADAFRATATVEVSRGTHVPDSASYTVAEGADRWLEECRHPAADDEEALEPATVDSYEQQVRLHIKPFIGNLKLSHLTPSVLSDFQSKLRKGEIPGETEKHPRSASMVRRVTRTLGTFLGYSQEKGLGVSQNVVREQSRRKSSRKRKHESRHEEKILVGRDYPTPNEIRAFVATLDGRWRPILLTAAFTGLRASELRGLRWEDVDLDKKVLHVRQRVDFKNRAGVPKSAAGNRTVPLAAIVLNTLREWKLACPKGDLGLVFPTDTGQPHYHANIIQRGLIPAWVKAGVVGSEGAAKYPGLHALRHFYASWLINRKEDGGLGLPVKMVSQYLGHSTAALTMNT
jgi:integrase